MEYIWAPWRMEYIEKHSESGSCFLCEAAAGKGELVVALEEMFVVVMNKFPYNSGHILVAPKRHVSRLEHLEPRERCALMEGVTLFSRVIQNALNPQGMNIGVNLGRVAGAGLEEHLHVHIVPRWNGDTNFMPVLADVTVVPEHMERTCEKLRKALHSIGEEIGGEMDGK